MTESRDLTVLVLAPTGRDGSLLLGLLEQRGFAACVVAPAGAVDHLQAQRGGAFLIAEEALTSPFLATLGAAIERQPEWADFPFIILTSSGSETEQSRRREQERLPLLNHTLLERPIRPDTLLTSVRSALRARQRQYEVRKVIEELQETSASLAKSEERNRLILQSTRDCIKLLDLQGRLLSMNSEGQEQLGIVDFATVRNRDWRNFWTPEYRAAAAEAIATACDDGAGRFEGEFLRPDGESSWWDVSVTPVRDAKGIKTHLLVVSRETTARKRAEKALIESEKLAAVGRLAASISHEINNPLEAVTNLLYIVSTDASLSTQGQAYLALADKELARVSQIAGQTLRFHRQATRPRALSTRELLEPVLALYQGRLVNSHISVDLQVRDLSELTCYEGDIRQVLNNLVGNALDAMKSGGRLIIRAQRSRDWARDMVGARITIADTGHGMPRQVSKRIFEAFYTTKGINGNGLGLWISHGIVKKHRGSLRVRSCHAGAIAAQPGESQVIHAASAPPRTGTVFTLFLPAQLAEAG